MMGSGARCGDDPEAIDAPPGGEVDFLSSSVLHIVGLEVPF